MAKEKESLTKGLGELANVARNQEVREACDILNKACQKLDQVSQSRETKKKLTERVNDNLDDCCRKLIVLKRGFEAIGSLGEDESFFDGLASICKDLIDRLEGTTAVVEYIGRTYEEKGGLTDG